MKTLLLITTPVMAQFTGKIHESPYIDRNSVYSNENTPYSNKNSEYNPANSRFGDNVIRDDRGEATGYYVRKEDGGVNFYSYSTPDGVGGTLSGGRIGYIAGESDYDEYSTDYEDDVIDFDGLYR